jgi:hypothetical protein
MEDTKPTPLRGMMIKLKYFSEIFSPLAISLRNTWVLP